MEGEEKAMLGPPQQLQEQLPPTAPVPTEAEKCSYYQHLHVLIKQHIMSKLLILSLRLRLSLLNLYNKNDTRGIIMLTHQWTY